MTPKPPSPADDAAEHAVVAWRLQHAECAPPCLCGNVNARGVDLHLEPGDFRRPHLGHIWQALDELGRAGIPITMTWLTARLELMGKLQAVGGHCALAELAARLVLSYEIKPALARVRAAAHRRHVLEVVGDGHDQLWQGDPIRPALNRMWSELRALCQPVPA